MQPASARSSVTAFRWDVAIVHFCVCIAVAVIGFFFSRSAYPPEHLIRPAAILLVGLFVWFLVSWRAQGNRLSDPYALFLSVAFLFNGSLAFLEVLSLKEKAVIGARFSADILLATLFLVALGLASLHLGALIGVAGTRPGQAVRPTERGPSSENLYCVRLVGLLLLGISFFPMALMLKRDLASFMSGGYFEAFFSGPKQTGLGNAPRLLAGFFIPGVLLLLAASRRRQSQAMVLVTLLMVYSGAYLLMGARGVAITPLVACAWLWHRYLRPLPKLLLGSLSTIILFVVFPVIRQIRNTVHDERFTMAFLLETWDAIGNSAIAIFSELGNSMFTVAHTLRLVPATRPFDFGESYFHSFLTLFPNLFWEIHPARNQSLSLWLVQTVEPIKAKAGGGLGFSFIAEAYLNFGWIGTPLLLAAVGFLLGRLGLWAQKNASPARMATVAAILAFFLMYARGEAALVVRPVVWYAFGPYLMTLAVRDLRRNKLKLGAFGHPDFDTGRWKMARYASTR